MHKHWNSHKRRRNPYSCAWLTQMFAIRVSGNRSQSWAIGVSWNYLLTIFSRVGLYARSFCRSDKRIISEERKPYLSVKSTQFVYHSQNAPTGHTNQCLAHRPYIIVWAIQLMFLAVLVGYPDEKRSPKSTIRFESCLCWNGMVQQNDK